jgi:hypothetical protein
MTLINVERSPNLELYTFVCNTLSLHDTEVERSPNLELYKFVYDALVVFLSFGPNVASVSGLSIIHCPFGLSSFSVLWS